LDTNTFTNHVNSYKDRSLAVRVGSRAADRKPEYEAFDDLVPPLLAEDRRPGENASTKAIRPIAVPTMPRMSPVLSVVAVLLAGSRAMSDRLLVRPVVQLCQMPAAMASRRCAVRVNTPAGVRPPCCSRLSGP
jgi:hypothetical protein